MTSDKKTALNRADEKVLPGRPTDPKTEPVIGGDDQDTPANDDDEDAQPDLDDVEPGSDADTVEK